MSPFQCFQPVAVNNPNLPENDLVGTVRTGLIDGITDPNGDPVPTVGVVLDSKPDAVQNFAVADLRAL